MPKVFFSYSHKDESLRDQLEKQLRMMKRQGLIETWHDRRIIAGSEVHEEIDQNLEDADIILILASPDFIDSDYCYDIELKRALERHQQGTARVIPVVLRHCDWKRTPFGSLRATPRDGKPIVSWPDLDEAFLEVANDIRAAVEQRGGRSTPTPSKTERAPVANVSGPRSSNLAIGKTFSDIDRDRHIAECFEFMARFFENSLSELRSRTGIETMFRRIDANRFAAAIYRNGKALSRCSVWFGEEIGRGIYYSYGESFSGNGFNESLSVENDDQALFMKPLGISMRGNRDDHLTFEGAAEYYWSMLIQPLQ